MLRLRKRRNEWWLELAGRVSGVGRPEIYRCTLVAHDYLFFTTLGVRDTSPSRYIGNYALMYALNRFTSAVQRVASGTKPHYEDDLGRMLLYCTPAGPAESPYIHLCGNKIEWEGAPLTYFTYNSVNTITQATETGRSNFPTFGRKGKFPPLNAYVFFVLGGEPGGVVRLGKKQVACRVYAERLEFIGEEDGEFEPSHPVNPMDLEGFGVGSIVRGELVRAGYPLLVNARLRGRHYVCARGDKKFYIAKPNPQKYVMLALPK
ncbi:MAG: type I-D CRISPR-associated protein Cas5/Csc1 [Thermoprotei archaeon]